MDNTRPTLRVCSLHGGLGLHRRCTRAQRSHQMALIERFFGRLKTVCAILSGKWTFSRAELPAVFAECVCVTHYHVSINPLTQDDDGIEQAVYDNAFMDLEEAAEGRREADRRYCQYQWPQRSGDWSPLNFWRWSYLEERVHP